MQYEAMGHLIFSMDTLHGMRQKVWTQIYNSPKNYSYVSTQHAQLVDNW